MQQFLFFVFCFCSFDLYAQSYYLTLNRYQTQYRDKNSNEIIELYAYPFHGSTVDLRDFKEKVEPYTGPDFVPLLLPQGIDSTNCVVFVCFIQQLQRDDKGSTLIILANHFNNDMVELFIDQNVDYNFTNDNPQKIDLLRGDPPITIDYYDSKQTNFKRSFLFELPQITANKSSATNKNSNAKRENKHNLSPWFGQFALTVGTGELHYNYISTFNGFPANYKVSYSTKGMSAGLLYNKWKLKIGLSATFENYFFYTSYLQYQYRVEEYDMIMNSEGELVRKYTGNTYTNSSFDAQQRNRISTAIAIQYAIKVGKKIRLMPGIEGGQLFYFTPNYVYNTAKNITYNNPKNEYWQYNLTFLGKTDKRTEIYFALSMQHIRWNPDNLFNDLVLSDLKTSQITYKTSIGINF